MSEDRSEDGRYVLWARAIKTRDNFQCILCGKKSTEVYLESHHLNSWDWDVSNRYSLQNGVTICGSSSGCKGHQQFHHIFGYGGNHEYQFEQFKKIYKIFQNLLSSEVKNDPIKPE